MIALGVRGGRRRCRHAGAGLRDVLRTVAVPQLGQRSLGLRDLGVRLAHACIECRGIERREHLPGFHPGALIDRDGADPAADAEGHIDLADIDIAVERERPVPIAAEQAEPLRCD